jgi:exodeoxyribonuclease VII small subunit
MRMFRGERGSREAEVTEAKPDIAKMPFEAALAELEAIVDQLEKGAVALDESIRLYERGEALKRRCDELLKNAEMRIEKIVLSADGAIKDVVPLDDD